LEELDMRSPIRKDLAGKKFGLLTGIRYIGKSDSGWSIWSFICDCGAVVERLGTSVATGNTKSCGCLKSESKKTHGLSETSEYASHKNMIRRCTDPKNSMFHRYGGRGITVCDRWLGVNGVVNFLADMGRKPTKAHTLERNDNDAGYSPENCIWATKYEQAQNRRTTHLITVDGETKSQSAWDASKSSSINIVGDRIRRGWHPEDAVKTPVAKYKRELTHDGQTKSLHAWENVMNLGHGTIAYRLSLGWSVSDAITKPSKKKVPLKRFLPQASSEAALQ
jgi:hypothetical protein